MVLRRTIKNDASLDLNHKCLNHKNKIYLISIMFSCFIEYSIAFNAMHNETKSYLILEPNYLDI